MLKLSDHVDFTSLQQMLTLFFMLKINMAANFIGDNKTNNLHGDKIRLREYFI